MEVTTMPLEKRDVTNNVNDERKDAISAMEGEDNAIGQTKEMRRKELVQFSALCVSLFLQGYNDGSIGPLLPRLQEHYNVNYTIVSLIFIFSAIGFMSGAAANVWFNTRFGFGKTIVVGAAIQIIGFTIQSTAPPFPAFVVGFPINGFGMSLQDAQANGYVSALKSETKMGVLHAVYGLGALTAPLVSTQFAQLEDYWNLHYVTSVFVALTTAIVLALMFRGRSQNECLADIGRAEPEDGESDHGHFRQIMGLRAVHLLAGFILVYVGVEVTLGGWMVTYIIEARGGGPSSGYVSTGFFGGLTLGRVLLLPVNKLVGERRVIWVYAAISIGLDILVWRVRSLIGDAVAVAFIGFFLGPMYPIAMNVAGRVIPPWLITGSIGWIAGFGQAGSAILPFITGAVSNAAGITALQPLLLGMMGLMLVLWALVPRNPLVSRSASDAEANGGSNEGESSGTTDEKTNPSRS